MRTPRTTLGVACAALFVVGVFNGALGPLIPLLAAGLSAPIEALGTMFTALFVGVLLAQLAGGWLNELVGLRNMVLIGMLLLTIGVLGITMSPTLPLLLASTCISGLGQGTLDISTNVLIPTVYAGRKAVSATNLLHFAFGAGAALAPVATSAAAKKWDTPMLALLVIAAIGLGTLVLGRRLLLNLSAARQAEDERTGVVLYRAPSLWQLAFLALLCIGGEMGVGGWTTVYLEQTSTLGAGSIALVVSAFWLALTTGRLVAAWLGIRVRSVTLLLYCVIGGVLGSLLVLVAGGGVVLTIVGTLILGASYGPIFPTSVVVATERFPFAPSRAVSVVMSVGSVGGMVLPPLQGVLLARQGPLVSAVLVAAGALGMIAVLLVIRRGTSLVPGSGEEEAGPLSTKG